MLKLRPHHIAISVRDLRLSIPFYKALGYKQVHRYDKPDMSNVHFKLGDTYLEMFCYKKNIDSKPVDYSYANSIDEVGVKHIAHHTDDIEDTLSELIKLGLTDNTTEIDKSAEGVEFFFIKDPDGVWVEFIKDSRYE